MLSIRFTHNLGEAVKWLQRIERAVTNRRAQLEWMRQILHTSHQDAFKYGGHKEGEPWAPTDPYWVQKMRKSSAKPLVWSGNAQRETKAVISGGAVEVRAPEYLGAFQFSPGQNMRKVHYDSAGFAVPEPDAYMRVQKINLKEREIFGFYESDANAWMDDLAQEAGLE